MGFLKSAVLLLSVPLIGWAAAVRVTTRLTPVCDAPAGAAACHVLAQARLLFDASSLSALVVLALLAVIAFTARLCRGNQRRLAAVFGVQIQITLFVLAGLILVQGAILTYSVWIVEVVIFHLINIYVLAFLAFGTLVACGAMLWSLATMNLRFEASALALPVTRQDQPRLWRFVDDLATAIGGRSPANILIGLDPSFYITGSKVRLTGSRETVNGETMYLSAAAMRLLSQEELAAIVAHELAHFQAADTRYSRSFLPIYRGLEGAIDRLTARWSLWSIALLPTVSLLGFAHGQFSLAERSISREREFAADRTAAGTVGPERVISSLVKLGTVSPSWPQMRDLAFSLINQDRALANIPESFEEHARHILTDTTPDVLLGRIIDRQQPHPIDTHPTLRARAQALGCSLDDAASLVGAYGAAASDLLDDSTDLEMRLTVQFNDLMAAWTRPSLG